MNRLKAIVSKLIVENHESIQFIRKSGFDTSIALDYNDEFVVFFRNAEDRDRAHKLMVVRNMPANIRLVLDYLTANGIDAASFKYNDGVINVALSNHSNNSCTDKSPEKKTEASSDKQTRKTEGKAENSSSEELSFNEIIDMIAKKAAAELYNMVSDDVDKECNERCRNCGAKPDEETDCENCGCAECPCSNCENAFECENGCGTCNEDDDEDECDANCDCGDCCDENINCTAYDASDIAEVYFQREKKSKRGYATCIKFTDGEVTKAFCDDNDTYNPVAGVAIALAKRCLGTQRFREIIEKYAFPEVHKMIEEKNAAANTAEAPAEETPVAEEKTPAKKPAAKRSTTRKPVAKKTTTAKKPAAKKSSTTTKQKK